MIQNRPFAVDGLIIDNNKILLIKRGKDPFKGFWALPGGHVEFNETVENAVIREMKEETSLDVTSLDLFNIYSNPNRSPEQHTIAAVYILETKGTSKAGDDAVEFQYFPLSELPSNLAFDHKQIIEDYLKLFG